VVSYRIAITFFLIQYAKDKQPYVKNAVFRGRITALIERVVEKIALLNQSMHIFSINQDFAQNDINPLKSCIAYNSIQKVRLPDSGKFARTK